MKAIEKGIDQSHCEMLLKTTEYFGTVESLSKAKEVADNTRSIHAIERLEELYQVLCEYGVEKYVSFDLGMLSKYNYYTGVIFKVYTYGVGDAILKGGRYDNLLGYFGKIAPAIGFVIVIDDLMQALGRQKIQIPLTYEARTLTYTKDNYEVKLAEAVELRKKGIRTTLVPEMTD